MIKNKILVSGSIAYDFIMDFDGIFKNSFVKKDLAHVNISFTGLNKKRFFGGCGANISYSLSLFGVEPVLFGVVGNDFSDYSKWMKKCGTNLDFVGIDKNDFTACAYILTDKKENQINIFSPGGMGNENVEKSLTKDVLEGLKYAILSPDICSRTVRLAKILIRAKVPYFFDPGQMTPAFKISDLKYLIENAYGFIANSYEVKLLCSRLKINKQDLNKKVEIFIETLGKNGSKVFTRGEGEIKIPAVKPQKVVDPTGCGDAYRGGFLAGLAKGMSVTEACKMGSLVSTYKIETQGTQNHKFTHAEFEKRLKNSF